MKIINFNKPIKLLDGKNMKDGTNKDASMKEILANMLVQAKAEKNAVRQLDTALSIMNAKGNIELEDQDFDVIKNIVTKSGGSVILVGQILKVLDEAKSGKSK